MLVGGLDRSSCAHFIVSTSLLPVHSAPCPWTVYLAYLVLPVLPKVFQGMLIMNPNPLNKYDKQCGISREPGTSLGFYNPTILPGHALIVPGGYVPQYSIMM